MKLKLNHADNITLVECCVAVRKNLQSALNKNKYNLVLIANTVKAIYIKLQDIRIHRFQSSTSWGTKSKLYTGSGSM